jgi:3'-phosphoadenosine 5'-phosphosulfate sulfotransferase (PAPS reductase)/FAD synthetase
LPRPISSQGSLKNGFRRLHRLQAGSLEEKIAYAHKKIDRALEKHENPALCWSGGKDSTVLLHLARQHKKDIPVIYNDTGVEFPENNEYVKEIADRWNINLYIAKPIKGETFWEITKKHGWPILGKEQSEVIEKGIKRLALYIDSLPKGKQKKIKKSALDPELLSEIEGFEKLSDFELTMVSSGVEVSSKCCKYLKEKPTIELEKKLGIDCKLLGIMAGESRRRSLGWIDYGDYYYRKEYFNSAEGIWKVMPLSIWTDEDIWAYHKKHRIPMSKLYSMGHDRNGCWTCGMGVRYGQLGRLRASHPKLFTYLMVKTEMGRELLRAKTALNENIDADRLYDWVEGVDIGNLLQEKPCYFDRL